MAHITLFTDGACSGNPGMGGYAYIMRATFIPIGETKTVTIEKKGSGAVGNATNNKMELTAVMMGLRSLKTEGNTINIVSDSKYVLDGIGVYLKTWKSNGWKKSDKKPVKNQEFWQVIDELLAKQIVGSLTWIPGHTGHPENEQCDSMAQAAIEVAQTI